MDTGQEEAGLPLTFYERLHAASVDEKLVLAREAAGHPGFDEEDAFEVGSHVEEALNQAGRYREFEGLLDAWKERAPRVHEAEPAVRTWRVELALRLPGRDVQGALVSLAMRTGDAALVSRLAEWCLYRGRLHEARAGLLEAWPRVREDETLAEWTLVDYVTRAVLTCMDAGLREEPGLSLERLNEQLSLFDRAVPHWVAQGLELRTGRRPWVRREGASLLDLSPEAFFDEQRALVMTFETELRIRQGWPWGRTQLLFPEALPPAARAHGAWRGGASAHAPAAARVHRPGALGARPGRGACPAPACARRHGARAAPVGRVPAPARAGGRLGAGRVVGGGVGAALGPARATRGGE
ncbi:hypothetical protein ACN28I_32570 [Archangium gephyra]|uniref:hypothetical protein n=1 Tax=Archangium gephyra TaxID=48 RepID=UPI003B814E2F